MLVGWLRVCFLGIGWVRVIFNEVVLLREFVDVLLYGVDFVIFGG